MSFATIQEMGGRRGAHQRQYSDSIPMMRNNGQSMGPPPAYKVDADDTLAPHWWNVRHWSWKRWLVAGVALVLLIMIVIVIAVVVSKKNAYPNYSTLTYSLADTCQFPPYETGSLWH